MQQHEAAREASVSVATAKAPLPAEAASEFADYHRGAYAFWQGTVHWAEARAAFEALLQRPKTERHYRSTWAAYMLGKLAVYEHKADAAKWFQLTRTLAKEGFADSLGLAAESYGWEARSELDAGHYEAAAKLYLTQLALGDTSAIVSLKAIIPDRPNVFGMLNFGADGVALPPDIEADPAETGKPVAVKISPLPAPPAANTLARCVADNGLRALVTAHVLATETVPDSWKYPDNQLPVDPAAEKVASRSEQWLAEIEKAKLKDVANAEQLGWIAYAAGRYDEAERWLALATSDTATAQWLSAKMLRRAGKLAEATEAMQKAWASLSKAKSLSTDEGQNDEFIYRPDSYAIVSLSSNAAGDLGALHLQRDEFTPALDIFYRGRLDDEASYVAERVLTLDELKKYVTSTAEQARPTPRWEGDGLDLRWLLARRFVREDRYAEAALFMPAAYQPALKIYVDALGDAADGTLSKPARAKAWSTAAWICRAYGMELMGTQVEPDNFASEGSFETTNISEMRAKDISRTAYDDNGKLMLVKGKPPALLATAEEKKRLAKNKPSPDLRYHYRYIAASLAAKAAALMPDQSEELADALNTAGSWIKDGDEKAADRLFQIIERRAAKTKIGKAASLKHWFVEDTGPWSDAMEAMKAKLEVDIEAAKAAKPQ